MDAPLSALPQHVVVVDTACDVRPWYPFLQHGAFSLWRGTHLLSKDSRQLTLCTMSEMARRFVS